MKLTGIIKFALGGLITAAGLYIFLKDVDSQKLLYELKSIPAMALIICAGFAILTLFIRSIRWSIMLPQIPGTHKKQLFHSVAIGFMVNNILPARLGETVRALVLWRNNHFPPAVCVGTLLVERVIDLLMFLGFFTLPIFILPECKSLRLFGYLGAGVITGSILSAIVYVRFQGIAEKIGEFFLGKFPAKISMKLSSVGSDLVSTLGWLNSSKKVLQVFVLSVLTSLCYPAIIIIIALSQGETSFGLLKAMFSQAYAAFGSAIPLAPGYVGTLHAIMLQGLTVVGMDGDKARALTIVYHAINYIPVTLVGLGLFFAMKLSFGDVFGAKKDIGNDKK